MQVLDQNVTSDDLVGDTKIKLDQLAIDGGLDEWFVIRFKGNKVGNVRLKVKWFPTGLKPKIEVF